MARILAKITADGVFVEELEHNPASWMITQNSAVADAVDGEFRVAWVPMIAM